MVTVDVYGIWSRTASGFEKETDGERIVLDVLPKNQVYCFIEHGGGKMEFETRPGVDTDSICDRVMRKESHGEDIVDVLEDTGFKQK